jgi:hypothetical protein
MQDLKMTKEIEQLGFPLQGPIVQDCQGNRLWDTEEREL